MTTCVGPQGESGWPDPVAVGICVVIVPEPKTATKSREHLDLAGPSPSGSVQERRRSSPASAHCLWSLTADSGSEAQITTAVSG